MNIAQINILKKLKELDARLSVIEAKITPQEEVKTKKTKKAIEQKLSS